MRNICCFAGHNNISSEQEEIQNKIYDLARDLIINENVTEFWAGCYGTFVSLAAKAINELKNEFRHIQLNLVIPYLTNNIKDFIKFFGERYDNILMAEIPAKTPKRFYISKCNQYMVMSSKFMICYVARDWGGVGKTLEFARPKKHIKILNIADMT